MKAITKFQAYNGTEFTDAEECALYEAKCASADAVIALLPPQPELPGCGFNNGGGYLQHDPVTFKAARRALLELALKEQDHPWLHDSIAKEDTHPSYAYRIISECCTKQLNDAWYRIACTDRFFREWGQPYYRDHPEEAKQVCLNATELTH